MSARAQVLAVQAPVETQPLRLERRPVPEANHALELLKRGGLQGSGVLLTG